MKDQTKHLLSYWRENRPILATVGSTWGFAVTVLFALYNGWLGIWHASLWYGSICIYYILLSLLRGVLLLSERKAKMKEPQAAECYRKRIVRATAGIMLAANAALIIPISLMVLDRRPIQTGLIPAIASAAYTTYKITAAAVKLKRASGTILERELHMIRVADALVSVLVLQNTLIIAVDGSIPPKMLNLVSITSAGIFLLVLLISGMWFVRNLILRQAAKTQSSNLPHPSSKV